jgi:hypothetical protein
MSEMTSIADRDERNGRFLAGHKRGGRPPGSRNKLSESFIADLRDCWERHGVAALEKCAADQPEVLIKVIASLMPKDINLNVGIDPASFADRFRHAAELLGHDIDPPRLRRSPRAIEPAKVIDHGG